MYTNPLAVYMERRTIFNWLRIATNRLLRDAKDFDDLFFGIQDLQELIEELEKHG